MPDDDPYRDPVLYDLEYEDHTEDIGHYVALASRARGPVLELACGNGRITLPMARAGATVHGLDLSAPMLRDLEVKLRREPDAVRMRVRYAQGDFRHLEGPARFPLVLLPFNALHHCRDHHDVLALFDGVRRSLRPGGVFALDCYLPDPELYGRDPDARFEERTFIHPRTGQALLSWEQSWYEPLAQLHHVVYVYQRPDGTEDRTHLTLRMFYPQELRGLIDLAGFDVLHEAADFRGRPLSDRALKWVVVLRPRAESASSSWIAQPPRRRA